MAITEVKAEQIRIGVLGERFPIASRAPRDPFGRIAPSAVAPMMDGPDGDAAGLRVLLVGHAQAGQQ